MSMQSSYYKPSEDDSNAWMLMQDANHHSNGGMAPLHYSFDSMQGHHTYPSQTSPQTSPTGTHPSRPLTSQSLSPRPGMGHRMNSSGGRPRAHPIVNNEMSPNININVTYAQSPIAQHEPESRYQPPQHQQHQHQQRHQPSHLDNPIKGEYDQYPSPATQLSMVSISTMPTHQSLPSTNNMLPDYHMFASIPERDPQGSLSNSHLLEPKPSTSNLKRNHQIGGESSPPEPPARWPKSSSSLPNPKRRKSSFKEGWQMSEDDKYLMLLKETRNTPWKQICDIFREEHRGDFKEATLQMRLKRLKEKLHQWTPEDEQRLDECKKELDKSYWSLIAAKMAEKGCKEKFGGSACERKWKQIEHRRASQTDAKQSSSMFTTVEEPDPPNSEYEGDEA